ncbi:MAG: ATP-binding protein [Ancalomicrobiaceae bacterium]|nr:ATP-binding protein [Ancalomicrobiaceae bacterium]
MKKSQSTNTRRSPPAAADTPRVSPDEQTTTAEIGSNPGIVFAVRAERRRSASAEANVPARRGAKAAKLSVRLAASANAQPVMANQTEAPAPVSFCINAATGLSGTGSRLDDNRWCGPWKRPWPEGDPKSCDGRLLEVCFRQDQPNLGIKATAELPEGAGQMSAICTSLLDDAGASGKGSEGVQEDRTKKMEPAIDRSRLAAIVEGSDDAIISKTLDGYITSWNAGATRMFGYTAQDMIGRSVTSIIPEHLLSEEQFILDALKSGIRIDHFDSVRVAKDGRLVDVSLTVSPIRDEAGNVIGASKIARDITARRRSEVALKAAVEAARRAQQEAENANRAKTEFLSVMSHEIRTPLTGISGFADLLKHTTKLTRKQQRYVDLMQSANSVLLKVVDNILDFAKVESGRLELEPRPFSLPTLVRDATAIGAVSASSKKLRVRYDVEPGIAEWRMGDEPRLRQILHNLLDNAVKFTEAGTITLDVRQEKSPDGLGRIRFAVTDTGIGIATDRQPLLFRHFSQADSSVSRRYGGTGLGLAICKRLVELMDGEIGIVSDLGNGATVWFTAHLPDAPQVVLEAKPDTPANRVPPRKARILVVDDIDTNREILEAFLDEGGFSAHSVGSGSEALVALGGEHYDLVLMDIQMPVMDGIATTKRIRGLQPPLRDIPIIAVSGNVLPFHVRSFLAAGMDDHIGKPISREVLNKRVHRWLPQLHSAEVAKEETPAPFDERNWSVLAKIIGKERANAIVDAFANELRRAFKSTIENARHEAHDLINCAGLLRFERLLDACRELAASGTDDLHLLQIKLEQVRMAQAIAIQTLERRNSPKKSHRKLLQRPRKPVLTVAVSDQ